MIKWYSKAQGLTQGTLFLLHDKKQEHAETHKEKRGGGLATRGGAHDKGRLLLFASDGAARSWQREKGLLQAVLGDGEAGRFRRLFRVLSCLGLTMLASTSRVYVPQS